MNISKIMLVGTFVCLCFSSCTNEEFPTDDTRKGSISLDVQKVVPTPTRAVDTDDYPVAIYSLTDNNICASYEKASLVPNKMILPVGMYYAEAHTPGEMRKIMYSPYYAGRDTFEILQAINTVSNVICRMANGSFTVRFSEEFAEVFVSWDVSIDDGTETAIIYTSEDGLTPPTQYLKFEENVKTLNVNFRGTTVSGNKITANNKLTKKQANEQYESDSEHFSGGDCIVINFEPVEGTDGDITGITLKADIAFDNNEADEDFFIDVEDNIDDDNGDTPGGDTPGDDNGAITLNLPNDMVVDATLDPSLGDTYIASESGIKSIKVRISSSSDAMISSLQDLSGNYENVDFLAGAEVVDNGNMVTLFSDLGQTLAVPSVGDKEYTFPIGNFFSLLAFLPGEHVFSLVITDMDGNTKDGVLKLTVK